MAAFPLSWNSGVTTPVKEVCRRITRTRLKQMFGDRKNILLQDKQGRRGITKTREKHRYKTARPSSRSKSIASI
jgi:hypothetical protein